MREEASALAGLLHRAGTGDEAAFADVYEQLSPMVYGMVLHVVGDESAAEQVSHDAFVEMWRQSAHAGSGDPSMWAARIAHRLAVERAAPAA